MENEISSGAHLGVVLIALAAIIAIGFGVFGIAKAIANDGTAKVETSLKSVSDQEFKDYDQVICTGTQVSSAIQNFAGKNVAVLVATQGVTDTVKGSASNFTTANLAGLEANTREVDGKSHSLAVGISGLNEDGSQTGKSPVTVLCNTLSGNNAYVAPIFVNYNALISGDDDNNPGTKVIGMKDGVMIAKNGLVSNKSGSVQFNLRTAAMKKSGTAEYVSNTSRFNAFTIKDSTGSYIGVAFVQINTK